MADEQTCEVGSIVEPRETRPYSNALLQTSGHYKFQYGNSSNSLH
jgi:hypothetical protein